MSIDRHDAAGQPPRDSAAMFARVADTDGASERRLAQAIDDFLLADDARLDDRLRAALANRLRAITGVIEAALRRQAAKALDAAGAGELAAELRESDVAVLDRLNAAGLLRDATVMRPLIARVRADVLGEALPLHAPDEPDQPSLLARLSGSTDRVIAHAARALLAAEADAADDLPADAQARLVWAVAAVLREGLSAPDAADHALTEAARRVIAAHDDSERPEPAALRLAAAIDARADEIDALLVEALADRRLSLFTALLAHALGTDFADARDIVLDPAGETLWLVLRALEIDRAPIARIALALSEADPRRDIDTLAATLDTIMAVTPAQARGVLAPLLLPPEFRAALRALAGRR